MIDMCENLCVNFEYSVNYAATDLTLEMLEMNFDEIESIFLEDYDQLMGKSAFFIVHIFLL